MPPTFLSRLAALSLAVAVLAKPASADGIMVMQAFARASATPTAGTAAAYVSLMNHAMASDRLLSVSTPAARAAEVHKSEVVDGVMKMAAAGPVEVPMHGTLEMKPGGYHIMLTGLARPLRKGEVIELTLLLEKAGAVKVEVPVGGVAASAPEHDMSHGMDEGTGQ